MISTLLSCWCYFFLKKSWKTETNKAFIKNVTKRRPRQRFSIRYSTWVWSANPKLNKVLAVLCASLLHFLPTYVIQDTNLIYPIQLKYHVHILMWKVEDAGLQRISLSIRLISLKNHITTYLCFWMLYLFLPGNLFIVSNSIWLIGRNVLYVLSLLSKHCKNAVVWFMTVLWHSLLLLFEQLFRV